MTYGAAESDDPVNSGDPADPEVSDVSDESGHSKIFDRQK